MDLGDLVLGGGEGGDRGQGLLAQCRPFHRLAGVRRLRFQAAFAFRSRPFDLRLLPLTACCATFDRRLLAVQACIAGIQQRTGPLDRLQRALFEVLQGSAQRP